MTEKSFGRVVGPVLCAVYLPYLVLFLVAEASFTLLFLWPVFPGLAISVLLPPMEFFRPLKAIGGALFLTILYSAAWCGLAWKFRRLHWLPILGAAIASLGLVQVMLRLFRA